MDHNSTNLSIWLNTQQVSFAMWRIRGVGQCNDRPLGKHFGVILGPQAGKQAGFRLFCQKFPLNLHQACSTCRLD